MQSVRKSCELILLVVAVCCTDFYLLVYCSQASPAMSRKSRLSREELEVHQALSDTDSESVHSAPMDPGQRSSELPAPSLESLQHQMTMLVQQVAALSRPPKPVGIRLEYQFYLFQ